VEERDGVTLRLSPASLKESTVPGGDYGVIVQEDVPRNTAFLEYGGELITLEEAKRRQNKVIYLFYLVPHIPPRHNLFLLHG
jgi:SET domain-containing protein